MVAIEKIDPRKIARIVSAVYVILCAFFLFALRCNPPEEPFENMGVIVNLGYMDTGMSDNVPTAQETEVEEVTPPTPSETESAPEEVVEESVTQDFEQTVVATPEKATKSPTTKKETEVTEKVEEVEKVAPEPQVNQNALFQSDKVNPNQGNDGKPGDKGKEDGQLESNIYKDISGNAMGTDGKGWGLTGRGLKFKPEPVNEQNKFGTVVVRIFVDKNGDVKKAEFTSFNSTTTDSYLVNLSIQEAYKVKFTPAPIDRDYQVGYVTFKYVAQ